MTVINAKTALGLAIFGAVLCVVMVFFAGRPGQVLFEFRGVMLAVTVLVAAVALIFGLMQREIPAGRKAATLAVLVLAVAVSIGVFAMPASVGGTLPS